MAASSRPRAAGGDPGLNGDHGGLCLLGKVGHCCLRLAVFGVLVAGDGAGLFLGECDDPVEIRLERNGDRHRRRPAEAGDRQVSDRVGGQFFVGYKVAGAAGCSDGCVGEGDFLDRSCCIGKFDLVPKSQRLCEGDEDAGDEVRDRRARREAEHDSDQGRGREQPSGDRANLGDDEQAAQDADRDDRRGDASPQHAVAREPRRRQVQVAQDRAVDDPRERRSSRR